MIATVPITFVELEARVGQIVQTLGQTAAFSPVWPRAALMAKSDVLRNFAESHAPDGEPWLPLAHGRPGQMAADARPLRDTGLLMASIQSVANASGIVVGTNLEYAAIHQFGGRIEPQNAKYLAIPLTREAKYAGSPRRFPTDNWRFVPTRTGGWLMIAARPQTARERHRNRQPALEPQYVLVKEVEIPARPFLGFSHYFVGKLQTLITDRAFHLIGRRLLGQDPMSGGQSGQAI